MTPSLRQFLGQGLREIAAANRSRRRRVIDGAHGVRATVDGRDCLVFCSNDYLGLAAHPDLAAAMARAAAAAGAGSGASQLITGYNREHAALEEELAAACGRERALLFATGYAANMGAIEALVGRRDTIVADALNHASLIDGARLSGARKRVYPHADAAAAAACLAQAPAGRRLLVTDTVFSMDGDSAPLPELAAAARAHDAWLMTDDAHGFGVLEQGAALAADNPADIYVATLGKAIGAAGAFVAGERDLIEYLLQRSRTLIFSTAPPPAVAAAARAGLRLAQAEPWRRTHLIALIERFRAGCAARAIDLPARAPGAPATPIEPLILGGEARAMAVSAALLARGFLVSAIRPPTVAEGTCRLRVTLSAAHDEAQVDGLLDALAESLHQVDRGAPQADRGAPQAELSEPADYAGKDADAPMAARRAGEASRAAAR